MLAVRPRDMSRIRTDNIVDDRSSPDSIGAEGTMKYLGDLGVQLDEPVVFAICTEIDAETMGEMERSKFVAGWEKHRADSMSKQKAAATTLRKRLSTDPEYFKSVYRHSFLLARAPGQKSVALDSAIEFWRLLFSKQGLQWKTYNVDWLGLWMEYLTAKWNKSISKDVWTQLEMFARKTFEDESMGWWNEEASWPSVIDGFVEYVKGKRPGGSGNGDKMDED